MLSLHGDLESLELQRLQALRGRGQHGLRVGDAALLGRNQPLDRVQPDLRRAAASARRVARTTDRGVALAAPV